MVHAAIKLKLNSMAFSPQANYTDRATAALAALPPGERAPSTHWIGRLVDPRASLDDLEKRKGSNSSPSVVQPVASCYTNYAILALFKLDIIGKVFFFFQFLTERQLALCYFVILTVILFYAYKILLRIMF
jgi:hypothetical protein